MLAIENVTFKNGIIKISGEGNHVFTGDDFIECTILADGEFKTPAFIACRFLNCHLKIQSKSALSHCFINADSLKEGSIADTDLLSIKTIDSDSLDELAADYRNILKKLTISRM